MENTPRNFALQLGSLVALYVSLSAIITLLFGVINVKFPDVLTDYYAFDSSISQVRFGIALLAVFFPTYLVLTRMVNRIRRSESHGTYLTLTKWLIYLSLLVGGVVILGDAVAIILAFLNGELTTRFILKALALIVVVGLAFAYYVLDARGYWQTHERESKQYGAVSSVLALIVLVLGFSSIELPEAQRALSLDLERINVLSNMQYQIGDYYRAKQMLPSSIEELGKIGFGYVQPVDPETKRPYEYTKLSDTSFELCATFSAAGSGTSDSYSRIEPVNGIVGEWEHEVGRHCFMRTIDPDFFQPYN